MTKKFKFYVGNDLVFQCNLKSMRCSGHNKDGKRCKRRCVIGFEYCFMHLASEKHLKIKVSNIPNANKGLFAYDKSKNDDDIIFRKGDVICEYNGDVISNVELYQRYANHTAPYAAFINGQTCIDGACKRGIANLVNRGNNNNRNLSSNSSLHVNNKTQKVKLYCDKNIKNNQEILCSYGQRYRMNEPNIKYTTK